MHEHYTMIVVFCFRQITGPAIVHPKPKPKPLQHSTAIAESVYEGKLFLFSTSNPLCFYWNCF